jgi:hypothetical protein
VRPRPGADDSVIEALSDIPDRGCEAPDAVTEAVAVLAEA